MDRLNFNHLRCFWATAKGGSIAAACETLGLTQPTISKQIGDLEEELGEPLFNRTGRRLVTTELGRTVYAYADDIFAMGQEMVDAIRGQAGGRPVRLHIGVSDVVPKLLTRVALEPALTTDHPMHLVCREGKTDQLLADLAMSSLDVVLTDAPLKHGTRVKAFNHKLGESPVAIFGTHALHKKYAAPFPESLEGAPMLLPTSNTAMRDSIDLWLEHRGIRPAIVAEFEDSALLKSFAQAGHGLFFAPTVVENFIKEQIGAVRLEVAEGVIEPLYAVTVERRITHPGVTAIVDAAKGVFDRARQADKHPA